jgi:molybdopterin/thiamine biosynthesis adenylyltransferase
MQDANPSSEFTGLNRDGSSYYQEVANPVSYSAEEAHQAAVRQAAEQWASSELERIQREVRQAQEGYAEVRDPWAWTSSRRSLADEMRPHARIINESMNSLDDYIRTSGRAQDPEDEFASLSAMADRMIAEQQEQEKKQKKKMAKAAEKKSIYKHRFSDAPWFEWLKKREVIILGAGGIGSWVAFALARIGCNLHIYDMDTIEPHNLGGQLYNMHQVNQNKAEAIAQLCHQFSGGEAEVATYGRFDEESPIGSIVISCFDNMAGRALAFQKWSEALASDPENAKDYLFIDGRLLAEDYQVYAVTAGRLDAYRKTLFQDGEVQDAMCSLKATTHCSMGIASDMVAEVSNFATNRSYGEDIREVPFSIIKSIPLFTYELNLTGDEHPQEARGESPQPAV